METKINNIYKYIWHTEPKLSGTKKKRFNSRLLCRLGGTKADFVIVRMHAHTSHLHTIISWTGITMLTFRNEGEVFNCMIGAGHQGRMVIKETCDWNMAPPSGHSMQRTIKLTESSQFTTDSLRLDYTGIEQMISIKWNRHRSDHRIFFRTTRTSKVAVRWCHRVLMRILRQKGNDTRASTFHIQHTGG